MRMKLAIAATLISLGALPALALPAAPVQQPAAVESDLTLVAQGCGPGWARNAYGVCRPMRPARAVVVAPAPGVVVVPRACPRGMRLTRHGRCVYY